MRRIALVSALLILVSVQAEAITYQYDANGQLVSVAYTPGRRVTYTYDASGNRTGVDVSIQIGDVSGDGNVDMIDAIVALQITTGSVPSAQAVYSDITVSGANKIAIGDILYIMQKMIGIR